MTKRKGKAIDLADDLVASLEQAVAIVKGDMAPGRIHEPVEIPDVDVRAARHRLGMSQPAFAAAFGVALSTLRKWEQRVRRPDGPARGLLRVIEREPEAVRRALAGHPTSDPQG